MTTPERVADNVNRALHAVLDRDPRVCVLGEDVADPYGGAFKVSRGLSTRHPRSVFTTPISEGAIVGVAAGLALCGQRPIVEMMFGDFVALAFDQILNFATKSVSMYGHPVAMHLVIRCPTGGHRGYGPTHSQSPQKHLIGIPHLALAEMSPFHDNVAVLTGLLDRGAPAVLIEQKTLYPERMYVDGVVDDIFSFDFVGPDRAFARVFIDDPDEFDVVVIAPGGLTGRALAAARELLLDLEIRTQILVPSLLYPFALGPVSPILERADRICVVEEGTAGGGWGSEVVRLIYDRLWGRLRNRVVLVQSRDSIIPSAAHLEAEVLVQAATIRRAIGEAVHG